MPTATPLSGLEKIAIVFARLHIDGLDHGIRGFIVQLSDGRHMMPGITAKYVDPLPSDQNLPLQH